jgi:hypothetical protein
MKEPPSTLGKTADLTPRAIVNGPSMDPVIIHTITQTMIGESLYKRRMIGKDVGEKRHNRFFWVHPYTRLYIGVRLMLSRRTCQSLVSVCLFVSNWVLFIVCFTGVIAYI